MLAHQEFLVQLDQLGHKGSKDLPVHPDLLGQQVHPDHWDQPDQLAS